MRKRILSIVLTLCMVLMLLPMTAFAETFTYEDFEYRVDMGKVTIEKYKGSGIAVDIPDTIEGYTVESIEPSAFSGCTSLTSINIPNGVTYIGDNAFSGCTSLTSINIPNGVTTIGTSVFSGCTSLTSITIPNSVTEIGSSAFLGCKSLESITIPSSVTSIKDGAFANCTSLTSITIPYDVETIGASAFNGCASLTSITIPNSVKTIGGSAFNSCTSLESITIPNSVTSISAYTFYGCTSLTSITIPNSVESISGNAFDGCSKLTSIEIPNRVTTIGVSAFNGCTSLESITIPNSVTSIGNSAFANCTSLDRVFMPGDLDISNAMIGMGVTKVTYSLNNDKVTISEISLGRGKTSVAIPEKICGYPVVAVAGSEQSKVGEHTCAGDTATCFDPKTCSLCGNYFSHNYTNEDTTVEGALKTAGTCTAEAVYYYSCIHCKNSEKNDSHTFTGSLDSDNHTGKKVWKQNETQHKQYWECCDTVVIDYEYHTWNNGVCSVCDYTCAHKDEPPKDHICDICGKEISQHSGGTATCTSKAVCEHCGEEYSEVDGTNHTGKKVWEITENQHKQYWDCCDAVVVDEDHTYEWQSENGKYWKTCQICGEETAKKDIPVITIDGADQICATQEYKFSFTLPEGAANPVYGYDFTTKGEGGLDAVSENNKWYGVVAAEWFDLKQNSFEVYAGATTADGFEFSVEKTVALRSEHTDAEPQDHLCDICGAKLSEHAGGEATCTGKAVCDYCGEEYGEINSNHHDLENIPTTAATVTETGNKEYWQCKDCEKYFSDADGKNEIADLEAWKAGAGRIDKLSPEIIDGKGQSVTEGEKKALSFRSNAAIADFIRVEVDSKPLYKDDYTLKEGSTIVTLTADYVSKLSAGEHTLGIVSAGGTASTTFTVHVKTAANNTVQAGDNSSLTLWFALLAVSAAGVIGTGVYSQKKKHSAK